MIFQPNGWSSRQPVPPLADVGDSRQTNTMRAKHDIIGSNYAALRKPDQRIARIIDSAPGRRRCAQLLTLD